MPMPSNTILAEQDTADARLAAVAFAIKDFQWRGSRPTPWPGDNQDYWIETARVAISLTREQMLERTIERAWLLLGGSSNWNTALALLPAGGIECERMVEIARDELGAAIGRPGGLRGMRADNNDPAPHDHLDDMAEEIMSEATR